MTAEISSYIQPTIETANLGTVSISKDVIKHFSRLCDDDFDEAIGIAEGILRSADIERIEVPAAIAALMAVKIDDSNDLEFWVHRDSSTVFLVKPRENYRVVEMAIKTSMVGFEFGNPDARP